MDSADFKITYQPQPSPEYCDGFADGYSRAWKECWEHMRQLAQAEIEDPANQDTDSAQESDSKKESK